MVEESTAASHSMAQEAQELARMVATFRTDAAISSITKDNHKDAKTWTGKKAPAGKTKQDHVIASRETAKAKPGNGADNWEDF
jgi:hypothetical protein